jgi:nicotinamidase-related amidase
MVSNEESMNSAKTLLSMLNHELKPPKLSESALIVVDAQREYVDGSVPLHDISAALTEVKTLLERARKLKVPIFHLVHHAGSGNPIFDPDREFVQIADPAKPVDGEPIIIKHLPSGFVGTNLKDLIDATKRKDVLVAGFMTHMCIDATTRGALDSGFNPTVVAAACTTRDLPSPSGGIVQAKNLHESSLAALADLVACVVPDSKTIPD